MTLLTLTEVAFSLPRFGAEASCPHANRFKSSALLAPFVTPKCAE
jgi:hypothetical protein